MAADILAACVTKSSATMLFTIKDKQVIIIHEDGFNFLCHPSVEKL